MYGRDVYVHTLANLLQHRLGYFGDISTNEISNFKIGDLVLLRHYKKNIYHEMLNICHTFTFASL